MSRKLFCELSPFTYKISVVVHIIKRRLEWFLNRKRFARNFSRDELPFRVYRHNSLIRRHIGNVDMQLQENKAVNLSLAAPKINGVLIRPGEIFSFWKLVGNCTRSKGYREGLIIRSGGTAKGIGGGMCQFSNLIHWMVLHSPLTIIEHHHHNQFDLFPDYGRQVPFGTGTSIMYNYLDYQFVNNTGHTFQLLTFTTDEYLCGELRCSSEMEHSYHLVEENHFFEKECGNFYRNNEVYRKVTDKCTGNLIEKKLIIRNHSKVMYGEEYIPVEMIRV